MKVKRVICLFLAVTMLAGLFAACSGGTGSSSGAPGSTAPAPSSTGSAPSSSAPEKERELLTITSVSTTSEIVTIKEDLYNDLMREKFGIQFEFEPMLNADFVTKMSLLFASGSEPDVVFSARPDWNMNEWIDSGYLLGFTEEEALALFPEFKKIWPDEEAYNYVKKTVTSPDGKFYGFPAPRPNTVRMCWVYREDLFQKLNLAYPKTTDELFDTMMKLKEATGGKVPYVGANQDGVLWAFAGFLQAFGMPELIPRELSYVNNKTGEFVPYAFISDNYRQFLIYLNKLYKNGLIWQEFATANAEQTNKFKSQGNGFVLWGYPEQFATYEKYSKVEEPDAVWNWSQDMVTYDESAGFFFKREPYAESNRLAFTADIGEEKLARMFEWANWAFSEAGQETHTFGIEGRTYEIRDGKHYYTDSMASPIKIEGERLGELGFITSFSFPSSTGPATHPDMLAVYKPVLKELADTFMNRENYYFFFAPVMPLTVEENKTVVDIQTSINTAMDEHAAKFIMGQIDPNNDAEWNKYIEALNKLGLQDFIRIRTDAYNRGKGQ